MSIYFTDPENANPKRFNHQKTDFDYKEAVAAHLMEMDVPLRSAEVAVIDLKQYVIDGYRNKVSPLTTAFKMLPDVKRMYKIE